MLSVGEVLPFVLGGNIINTSGIIRGRVTRVEDISSVEVQWVRD